MDTNTIALIQALTQQKPISPNGDFWILLAPGILTLIAAVVGWIKVNTIDRKTDALKEHAAVVEVKADAAHEVAKTILVDVNSSKTQATTKAGEQETTILKLDKKVSELEETIRQRALQDAQNALTPSHLNAINEAVSTGISNALKSK